MSRSDVMTNRMDTGAASGANGSRGGWVWVARLCGWLLGGMFLYAGISKLLDPAALAQQVRNYQLAPWWAIHPTAIVLPWIEIVAGLLLILGIWAIEATMVLTGLLGLFLIAIGWAMHQGLDIECGCFAGHAKVGWLKIAENVAMLAVAGVGIVARRRTQQQRPLADARDW